MSRVLRVLHTSDWQCGRPFLPAGAEALVRLAQVVGPDVVVAAGDLTQRAKRGEFHAALALKARLPDVPFVTTPGNHDVPLFRVAERMTDPFRNWRREISAELDTVTVVPGATFVALCSAAPHHRLVNGRLRHAQFDWADAEFEAAPQDNLRLLVVHHHFLPTPDGEGGAPLRRASEWLDRIERSRVDAVFGGHVHRTHVRTSSDLPGRDPRGPGVPILASGTATSRRGRGPEAGWNSVNVVDFSDSGVEVTSYLRAPVASEFVPAESWSFPRRASTEGIA